MENLSHKPHENQPFYTQTHVGANDFSSLPLFIYPHTIYKKAFFSFFLLAQYHFRTILFFQTAVAPVLHIDCAAPLEFLRATMFLTSLSFCSFSCNFSQLFLQYFFQFSCNSFCITSCRLAVFTFAILSYATFKSSLFCSLIFMRYFCAVRLLYRLINAQYILFCKFYGVCMIITFQPLS